MHKLFEPETWLRVAQVSILLLACGFGLDYIMEPPWWSLYIWEQMMGPLQPWGAAFLLLGLLGLFGELWLSAGHWKATCHVWICRAENRWWPVFSAHVGLCGMYAALTTGCLAEMIYNTHLYGIRVLGGMLTLTAGHAFFALKRRHAP